jgi:putative nucleotidyltransferase with HDIG domain
MAEILLVAAERERAAEVRACLRQDGHHVTWLRSLDDWPARERELEPDLIVAPLGSPEPLLGARAPRRRGLLAPILLVQHDTDPLCDVHDDARLVDRVTTPCLGEELQARVDALLTVRQIIGRNAGAGTEAASPARRDGFGEWLRGMLSRRLPRDERPGGPYLEVAARVAEWADRRDAFENGHSRRVAALCEIVAEVLRLEQDESAALGRAALLHDIGKIALPIEILHRPGPLEEQERRLIRTHPARGAALLRALDSDDELARVVLCHHERPDGAGYYGKSPESVPRASWVLAVAEAYDAMTSTTLSEPLSAECALDVLSEAKGSRYDADAVEALCVSLRPRARAIPLSRAGGRLPIVDLGDRASS